MNLGSVESFLSGHERSNSLMLEKVDICELQPDGDDPSMLICKVFYDGGSVAPVRSFLLKQQLIS